MVGIPAVSHVLPSLEVIRELVGRGHRVTSANDPAVASLITATGAEFVPYDSRLPVADNDWPDDPIAAMDVFLDDAIRTLPQLQAVYGHDRPLLQLSPTFVAWRSYEQDVAAHLWQLPGADVYRARFAAWPATCGTSTTDVDAFSGRPPRALALVPRAMQPHADQVDSRRPAFYRQCPAAYGGLAGWHVVLQIGRHTDATELGDIPPNIEVHPWVPQLAILEQADAFITHAGMGGSSEGLFTTEARAEGGTTRAADLIENMLS